MTYTSEKVSFKGGSGAMLAARLDIPAGPVQAWALFAHCFTCTKDIKGAARLAGALTQQGIAVLRFDFTGLGNSEGEFANTNFTSNIHDLVAAADWLREHHSAPSLLIGHSLGGAAVLAAAHEIPECTAVATIAAPADPAHVTCHFGAALDSIRETGAGEINVGGGPFTITQQFLDDVGAHNLNKAIRSLDRALLILHSPYDEIVGIENAERIFVTAKHPKSFVSLDDADHLMHGPNDAVYVAGVIAAWAKRYVAADVAPAAADLVGVPGEVFVQETGNGVFQQRIDVGGRHELIADEPQTHGGLDSGPSPYDLLLAGLGACTAMTLRMYAERKGLALDRVSVRLSHAKIHAEDCADCHTQAGKIDVIQREVVMEGNLDQETRARLLEIADKCPVHRTLHSEVKVVTKEG